MENKNNEQTIWIVKYSFGGEWCVHTVHTDPYSAKQALKSLKKHIGEYGTAKIATGFRRV